jgi:hypothetical protein
LKDTLFSRDLLYPTENLLEPGSVHIEVLNPDNRDRIPVVIEDKSLHSPVKYIDSILRIMQGDVFDRIFIDLKKNASIYIKTNGSTEKEYAGKEYISVSFSGEKTVFHGIDSIEK